MFKWVEKRISLSWKLAFAFGSLCLLVAGAFFMAALEVGRMESIAPTGDIALMEQALRDGGDIQFLYCGGAVVAALTLSALYIRAIAAPYASLVWSIESLAAGDTASPIAFVDRKDGLGRAARALERVQALLADLDAEVSAQRAHAEEERRKSEQTQGAAEIERRVIMAALANGLSALSVAKGIESGRAAPRTSALASAPRRTPAAPKPRLAVDNSAPPAVTVETGEEAELSNLLNRLAESRIAAANERDHALAAVFRPLAQRRAG